MARLGVAGISLALVLAPGIAMAAADSAVGAPPVPPMPVARAMPMPPAPMAPRPMMHGDRWASVPGGWNAYRQPGYGYTLPRYWVAPANFIADPRGFGLPQPARGYGWSRYYDDVVLTDRWGRVYDWRSADDLRRPVREGRHRKHRRDRYGDDAPLMRPHWDMAYDPEPRVVVEPAPAPDCREVQTVRYVTDYVPVRAKAKPRGKYVPVKRPKEIPIT